MKKIISFIISLAVIASFPCISSLAGADTENVSSESPLYTVTMTTAGHSPHVTANTTTAKTTVRKNVEPEKVKLLNSICEQLKQFECLNNIIFYNEGISENIKFVSFNNDTETINKVKQYIADNDIDESLVLFEIAVPEFPEFPVEVPVTEPAAFPENPSSVTAVTAGYDTVDTTEADSAQNDCKEKVDPEKVKLLNSIYEQLKQFECLNNIIFYNEGISENIKFVSFNNDTETINKVKQYIADNGIDENLVSAEIAVPEGSEEAAVMGDISGDGKADVSDAVMMQKYLTKKTDTIPGSADLNHDGTVDVFDYIMLKHIILS